MVIQVKVEKLLNSAYYYITPGRSPLSKEKSSLL